MKLHDKLRTEAEKQYKKACELRARIKAKDKKYEKFIENIDAYLADYKYFLVEKKPVEAFEAVVWAWAWIEIGLDQEFLESREKS